MWFHLELKRQGYKAAEYGIAISDSPIIFLPLKIIKRYTKKIHGY